jgi:hypothetical protein
MSLALPKPVRVEKAPKRIVRTCRPRRKRKGTLAALKREADRLWSLIVRARDECESPRAHVCRGAHQGAHGFGRSYWNTRWLPINGFKLCQAEHVYYTHRPIQWRRYLVAAWGCDVYDTLERLALRAQQPDVAAALEKLRAEAEELGIA